MKRFCDLLTRRRSNRKTEIIKSSISPLQSINQSAYPYSDQASILFNRQTRCTCHYFKNSNENNSTKQVQTKVNPSDTKYILTVEDFCFWHDVRSTLLDVIDQVVAIDENRRQDHEKIRRPKTSIAIQTSSSSSSNRRNAKIQANTMTLFPLQKPNISSTKVFL